MQKGPIMFILDDLSVWHLRNRRAVRTKHTALEHCIYPSVTVTSYGVKHWLVCGCHQLLRHTPGGVGAALHPVRWCTEPETCDKWVDVKEYNDDFVKDRYYFWHSIITVYIKTGSGRIYLRHLVVSCHQVLNCLSIYGGDLLDVRAFLLINVHINALVIKCVSGYIMYAEFPS